MRTLLPPESAHTRVEPSDASTLPASKTRRTLRILQSLALLAISAVAATAQTSFGSIAIGASSSVSVSVTATAPGTVATIKVLTLGNSGLDYASAAGGTCSGASLLATQQCTQPVTFTPAYPGSRPGAVVLLDSSNNVLATAFLSGTGTGGLGLVIPGAIQTFAGDGRWQDTLVGDAGPATQAELFLPSAVALDGVGNLYIADSNHNRIRMVCAGTTATIAGTTCTGAGIITTIAGVTGVAGYAGDGTQSTSSTVQLSLPSGLAIDGAGNLYFSDSGNDVVRRISAVSGIITTFAGNHTAGFSGDGGPAASAKLDQPFGLAFDSAANLYIADINNSRIRAVCSASGNLFGTSCPAANDIVTVTGSATAGFSGDGTQATAAELNGPFAVAIDPTGNLFIADTENNRVRAVCATAVSKILGVACTAAGVISTVAGDGIGEFAGDGAAAATAEVNSPSGLAFDPAGNLYIADTQNFRIRKISASTGVILTIGGNGSGNFGGDGGSATDAGIHGPYGLALDNNGNLLFADYFDQRVRTIQSNLSIVIEPNPVRQGDTSPPTPVTVENDGSGPLTLTSIALGVNVSIDPVSTTCTTVSNSLAIDQACIIGAEFAPASTPALSGDQVESGNIDVNDTTVSGIVGSNSPLVIQVTGTATPVNATVVALTSSPNPSTFNQSVTFSAAITTGAGTGALTGTVTFYDGATKLQAGVPLDASSVATFKTAALTVGSHSITAVYSGDSGHFAGTSSALSQIVNEVTTANVVSSANPSALNQSVTFTVTVTSTGGGVTPDGNVTFMDGTTALSTKAISASGVATYATATLAEGVHDITVIYTGDPTRFVLGTTSNDLKQDVLAGSTVALTSAPNPSTYGIGVLFTATVTANGTVKPTGTVNFLDGANQIGTATLVGTTGVTTFTTASLAVGSHPITAQYVGNSSDGPGTSPAVTQVVNKADTITTVTAAPSPGIAGKQVALAATVAVKTGSATVTGTVTFTDGATTLGTASVAANGTATLNFSFAPGAHSIVATYGGDGNDNGSASAALPLTVVQATTQVALTTSGSPAVVLSQVVFKAVVTGNGGTPTGSVSFVIDGSAAGSATLDSTGTASFNDSSLAVGTHSVVASYSGDTNDAGSSSSALSQVITAIPTTTALGVASTGGSSPAVILVATTLGTSGPVPTGTITFTSGSTTIGSAQLDSSGVATMNPDLAPGNYSIIASYGGDSIHSPSQSAAVSVSTTPIGFSVIVDPPKLTLVSGQNGTVQVTITATTGFSDTIGMGCLTLPPAVNCHFSSNSVKVASGQSQTVQLTIDTNAPLSGGTTASAVRPGGETRMLAGLFLPVSLFFGFLFWRLRRRSAAALVTSLVLFLAGALALNGCGGGFKQVTAAPGTYTIQVGGIGSGSNTSHYQNVILTVTK